MCKFKEELGKKHTAKGSESTKEDTFGINAEKIRMTTRLRVNLEVNDSEII